MGEGEEEKKEAGETGSETEKGSDTEKTGDE